MSRDMALPLRVASSHSMPALLITSCSCAEQAHPAQTCLTCILELCQYMVPFMYTKSPNGKLFILSHEHRWLLCLSPVIQDCVNCTAVGGGRVCILYYDLSKDAWGIAAPWSAGAHSLEVGAVAPGQAPGLAMRFTEGMHRLLGVPGLRLVLLARRAGSGCKARGGLDPLQGLRTHVAHLSPASAEQCLEAAAASAAAALSLDAVTMSCRMPPSC